MEKIEVVKSGFTVNEGFIIGLNEKQAKTRAFGLEKIKDGIYEVKKQLNFKIGEVISVKDIALFGKGSFEMIKRPESAKTVAQEVAEVKTKAKADAKKVKTEKAKDKK